MTRWTCSRCGPVTDGQLLPDGFHSRLDPSLGGNMAVICAGRVSCEVGADAETAVNEWQWRCVDGNPVFIRVAPQPENGAGS